MQIGWRRAGFDMEHRFHLRLEYGRADLMIINKSRRDTGTFYCVAFFFGLRLCLMHCSLSSVS